jgi:hypothetical protein
MLFLRLLLDWRLDAVRAAGVCSARILARGLVTRNRETAFDPYMAMQIRVLTVELWVGAT